MKGAQTAFQDLLSRSYLSMALAPCDHGKQPLQLQVFLNDSALLDCASGELLLAQVWSDVQAGLPRWHIRYMRRFWSLQICMFLEPAGLHQRSKDTSSSPCPMESTAQATILDFTMEPRQ